jgi:hypothetical protein
MSYGGCAPKERPLAGAAPFGREWADQDQRSTAHARSKVECCASFPETASISSVRRARHAALAWRRTPQLARRTAVVRQRREASRRHSALSQGTGRPQPAWHGARAQQVRVLRSSQRQPAPALAWRWAPKLVRRITAAEGERILVGAAPLYRIRADHNPRRAARRRSKLECRSDPQTAAWGLPFGSTSGNSTPLYTPPPWGNSDT